MCLGARPRPCFLNKVLGFSVVSPTRGTVSAVLSGAVDCSKLQLIACERGKERGKARSCKER